MLRQHGGIRLRLQGPPRGQTIRMRRLRGRSTLAPPAVRVIGVPIRASVRGERQSSRTADKCGGLDS